MNDARMKALKESLWGGAQNLVCGDLDSTAFVRLAEELVKESRGHDLSAPQAFVQVGVATLQQWERRHVACRGVHYHGGRKPRFLICDECHSIYLDI